MKETLQKSGVYAMELSQYLSCQLGINYKDTHKITGKIIRIIDNENVDLMTAFSKVSQKENLKLSQDDIKIIIDDILDYKKNINKRIGLGGASKKSILEYLGDAGLKLKKIKKYHSKAKTFDIKIESNLNKELKRILGNEFQRIKLT